ncbi:ferredoxin [Pseudanabaena galeata UHCC 0370]|jgi:ferredoxin|uniref:Ferredoxin n=1 Tax=Pseudanabaena galeata UHCC 0370 TaxID=3110310 RepID=A0ABU5TFV2_9CYAN|nr:ferredoxin [Pseudanabaena galeata]MEA5477149.1 ferredoxin [Pseudanabaena galeata UHCC 0370]WGS74659.1 ferredoxin [Pseudanabaena galeata CCNP1313]
MDNSPVETAITTSSEPEIGDRSGFEPELGGELRQNAVFVDETVCIGCGHCAHTASSTFFLEEDYGRARVIAQDGDEEDLVQEAIDTCPVDCIAWVNYNDLNKLEEARKHQIIQNLGIIGDGASLRRAINTQN